MPKYKLTWKDLSWSDFKVYVFALFKAFIPKGKIDNLDKLKYVITSGSKNKAIDLEAAKKRKIIVCGTEINFTPTSELTWGLI